MSSHVTIPGAPKPNVKHSLTLLYIRLALRGSHRFLAHTLGLPAGRLPEVQCCRQPDSLSCTCHRKFQISSSTIVFPSISPWKTLQSVCRLKIQGFYHSKALKVLLLYAPQGCYPFLKAFQRCLPRLSFPVLHISSNRSPLRREQPCSDKGILFSLSKLVRGRWNIAVKYVSRVFLFYTVLVQNSSWPCPMAESQPLR